jgi:Fur family ferric uptake transcriptional regulator
MRKSPNQTRQREAIRSVLASGSGPMTAEEILIHARALCERIGERTVFRTLHEMVANGLLVKVSFPAQPPRYERTAKTHHPHLICWGCEHVFDLPGETPEVASKCTVPPGFVVQGEEVVLYGLCPACAERREGVTNSPTKQQAPQGS